MDASKALVDEVDFVKETFVRPVPIYESSDDLDELMITNLESQLNLSKRPWVGSVTCCGSSIPTDTDLQEFEKVH